jgi:hypothetical protein
MESTSKTALEIVHRLLFRALAEMRAQGFEHNNKVVFHLADLFHNVVLEMKDAAEGNATYEAVLRFLREKAKEKGCEKWLDSTLAELELSQASKPSTFPTTSSRHSA